MSQKKGLHLIVAATESLGIGVNGALPWRIKRDMQFFKDTTLATADPALRNAVIMGRKSWESIPPRFRPLAGRLNIVITSQADYREAHQVPAEVVVSPSFEHAVEAARAPDARVETVYVIGGAAVYLSALQSGLTERILLTVVTSPDVRCDVFFPMRLPDPDGRFVADGAPSQEYDEDGWRFQFRAYRAATTPGTA